MFRFKKRNFVAKFNFTCTTINLLYDDSLIKKNVAMEKEEQLIDKRKFEKIFNKL